MTGTTFITDEDLTAYLDGEADDDLRRRIDAAKTADPALPHRLDALSLDVASLRTHMLASYPPPPPLPRRPERRRLRSNPVVFLAGLAAGMALAGIVFTSFLERPRPSEEWANFVASYQMLYTIDTLNMADPSDVETAAQLLRVSDAVDLDLRILPEIAGLTFKRAQILGFQGRPLIQIAYQRADGTPVALCIISSDTPSSSALIQGQTLGLKTVQWNKPGHGFLLIGDMEAGALKHAAEIFAATL